jgi:parallel beta-helix repeat protein
MKGTPGIRISGFLVMILLILMIILIGSGKGKTIIVDDDGGEADHTTIQEAIDAAEDVDRIRVWKGTYFENVVIDRRIQVIGNGSDVTTIDGGDHDDTVRITANGVELSGFSCINAGGAAPALGINIRSAFNVIANNTCTGNRGGIAEVDVFSAWNNTIVGNDCSGNDQYGILVIGDGTIVLNNTCSDNPTEGILVNGDGIVVRGNTCFGNGAGIRIIDGYGNSVVNNTCVNGGMGIRVDSISVNLIANNTCRNSSHGIQLFGKQTTVWNNTLSNCGILMPDLHTTPDYWNTHSIEGTTVNGKPVYYLKKVRDFTIPADAGQVIIASCTNITIEDQDLVSCNAGISIGFSDSILIRNVECSNISTNTYTFWGSIGLIYTDDVIIENVTIMDSEKYGIFGRDCDHIMISNSTIIGSRSGVYLVRSEYCRIANTSIRDCREGGIYLWNGRSNDIIENMVEQCETGVILRNVDTCEVLGNTIEGNVRGIRIKDEAERNHIHGNLIQGNSEYGIHASGNDGVLVNATDNWWGHSSGPFHPTENPNGTGDNVTDDVIFFLWYNEEDGRILNVDAGEDRTIDKGDMIRFIGRVCDPHLDIILYEWDFNGDGEVDWSSNESGEVEQVYPDPGIWSAALTVTEKGGMQGFDSCVITILGNRDPVLLITEPLNGSNVSGVVIIRGTATDLDGTIDSVEVSVDSGDWILVTGKDEWWYSYNTTSLGNGNHSLTFRAFDGWSFSDTLDLILLVENHAVSVSPRVTIEGENGETVWGSVLIGGIFDDPEGEIQTIEVWIDGQWNEADTWSNRWEFVWHSDAYPNGNYEIIVRYFNGTEYSEGDRMIVRLENPPDNSDDETFIPGFGTITFICGFINAGAVSMVHRSRRSKQEGK